MADEEEVGLDAGEHEEEELDGQQMLALMFQQNQWEIIKTGAVKRREICANNSKILKILRSFFK